MQLATTPTPSPPHGLRHSATAPFPGLTDPTLVGRMARGDREALATLYERYRELLVGLGVRILQDRREAQDVAHDVFLEAWRRADAYDPSRGTVRAWLVLRMRCRAVDRRRSAASIHAAPLVCDTRLAPANEAPDERYDQARVAEALHALPDAQRDLLVLGYYEGLSSSEIATRLEIPLGTVKSRVAAAVRALRGKLRCDHESRPGV